MSGGKILYNQHRVYMVAEDDSYNFGNDYPIRGLMLCTEGHI